MAPDIFRKHKQKHFPPSLNKWGDTKLNNPSRSPVNPELSRIIKSDLKSRYHNVCALWKWSMTMTVKQIMVCREQNLRLITELFLSPQSSGNTFSTTSFERTMFSALFSLSSSWKYRECDEKTRKKTKQNRKLKNNLLHICLHIYKGTTGIHPIFTSLSHMCNNCAQSCLVPLPVKNKRVPKHSIKKSLKSVYSKVT